MDHEQPKRVAYNCETDLAFRDGLITHLIKPALECALKEDEEEGIRNGLVTREVTDDTSEAGVRMTYDLYADEESFASVSATSYGEERELSDEAIQLMRREIAADTALSDEAKQRLIDNLGNGLKVEFFIRQTFEVDLMLMDVTQNISFGYEIEEIEISDCGETMLFDFEDERETVIGDSEWLLLATALTRFGLITDVHVKRFVAAL